MKTLGEYYREKVLSHTDIVEKELLSPTDQEIKIVRDLFGWTVTAGKEIIECRSEEEARYVAIFYACGMHLVMVPQDDEYLKSILPKLEALKKRIEEIIDDESAGILNWKIRERLRRDVLREVVK